MMTTMVFAKEKSKSENAYDKAVNIAATVKVKSIDLWEAAKVEFEEAKAAYEKAKKENKNVAEAKKRLDEAEKKYKKFLKDVNKEAAKID
jgi:hypothetical protein